MCAFPNYQANLDRHALGAFPGLGWPFTCVSFLERQFDDVVAVELPHGTTWLERKEERTPYEHTFLKLQQMALPEAESVEFVVDTMDGLSQP